MRMFPQGKLLIAEDVHDSIWYAANEYKRSVEVLRIDRFGQLAMDKLEKALNKDVSMLCINHVSHETGAIHPVNEIADLCVRRQKKILIDGAQSLGHLPVDMNEIPFTYYTFSGHKFGSVKSVGGTFIRDGEFEPLIKGGKQEWNLRAGTEDLPGLSAMVAALKMSLESLHAESIRLSILKESMLEHFRQMNQVIINSSENSVPGILSVSIPGITGNELVTLLAHSGFAISTGSACHANEMEPSRIIKAMGRKDQEALGTIRISMGRGTTDVAVNHLMKALKEIIN
jgi:cysteine desulfurase